MTYETYKEQKQSLYKDYLKRLKELSVTYASVNDPHKIGDTITDHMGDARIIKKAYSGTHNERPAMRYLCENLLKSGKVSKRQPTRWVYQCNLKEWRARNGIR